MNGISGTPDPAARATGRAMTRAERPLSDKPLAPSRGDRWARTTGHVALGLLALLLWAGGFLVSVLAQVPPTAGGPPLAPPAQAAALAGGLAALEAQLRQRAPAGVQLSFQPGLPDARLRLAPCAAATSTLIATAANPGNTARLQVRCTQGAAWQVPWPVQVQAWAPALVATVALPAGTPLAPEHLRLQRSDWAEALLSAAPATTAPALLTDMDAAMGRTLARALQPGQALRAADLASRQWFASGAQVRLVAVGPGFMASGEGQALQPGLEGQSVRVRTDSGRVVVGMVAGDHRVELRP
jgi:flagellar basal body P-ring formation protein FlgA